MAATDELFEGSLPEIYDRLVVPLRFESYACDLAARITKVAPRDVLETAAGTGVLTRAMASLLPAHTRITATDLNQPMLSQAMARQSDDPRIAWKQADALTLPFEDQSFNVVACQFGVMFFPDKVQGYKEAYRVLRQGGRFFFSVWDRISENDFADVITDALTMVFPQDPPRFLAQASYGYFHERTIRDDLKAAGFTRVLIEVVEGVSKSSSARDAAIAFCQGTPLRNEIEARDPSRLEEATVAATNALAQRFGSCAIEGRMRAVVITAMR